MAIRGVKVIPPDLRLLQGRPTNGASIVQMDGECEQPDFLLLPKAIRYWNRYIVPAHWLTRADETKSAIWCNLMAEYEADPEKMIAAKMWQLRGLGSELGFDPVSRTRIGSRKGVKKDALDKYRS